MKNLSNFDIPRIQNAPKIKDKEATRKKLTDAVMITCEKYSNFCGILIGGSFASDEKNPRDIDIIPVLKTYDDNWNFASQCEDITVHDKCYYDYKDIEEFLGKQIIPLPKGFKIAIKYSGEKYDEYGNDGGLLDIPQLVALDKPEGLKYFLNHKDWNIDPETFIGREEVKKRILEIMSS